ncbi:MAG: SurA N-terminal domain-containing protein [Candidatus Omnitrophota bacterium]|nr:SurA N-terminal domain-containing protein [Candidatus Omnitrophota bacterium]MDD5518123.1 SurA N-terminal domain-containing protein [Candidatus Omnitrophota bacterium]
MRRIINLRFFLVVFFLPIYCLLNTWFPEGRAPLLYAQDQIVAIVNNEVITQKDLNDFLHFMSMQLSREYKDKELEDKISSIKPDLLNRLIEDRLILQEAKKEKIGMDENRVNAKISEIKKQYRSDSDFHAELMTQGLTQADIENKIREQFLMFSVVGRKVRSKITVKPEEVTEFYETHKKDFISGEGRELEAYSLENEDQAGSFSYNLRVGKKPQDLVTRYPFTVSEFNVYKGEELKGGIGEVVFKLGINEVSGPVKIEDKYYVFKLINIIPAKELTLVQVQGRIHSFLFDKKMQEEFTKWLNELKKKSYIKIK